MTKKNEELDGLAIVKQAIFWVKQIESDYSIEGLTLKDRQELRVVLSAATLMLEQETFKKKRCDDITYNKPWLRGKGKKFIVRQYDGFDNNWIDITKPLSLKEAMKIWRAHTKDGTEKYCFEHIDYYEVFPAGTKMLYSAEGQNG
jgi:hypothetical protein